MHRVSLVAGAAVCGLFALGSTVARAGDGSGDNAVAAKVGALGFGIEYSRALNDRLGVRVGLNGAGYGFNAVESGIDYRFDLNWGSLSAGVDFHPFRGAFRISGGLLHDNDRIDAVSRPAADVVVGNTVYTAAEVGTLRGRVSFDATAPYLTVGWDWSRLGRALGMVFDIGVVDQGRPKVTLAADGGLVADPMFEQDIATERAQLQDSLSSYDLMPYASLGLVFRF